MLRTELGTRMAEVDLGALGPKSSHLHSHDRSLGWDGLKAWPPGHIPGSTCSWPLPVAWASSEHGFLTLSMAAGGSKSKCPRDKEEAALPLTT